MPCASCTSTCSIHCQSPPRPPGAEHQAGTSAAALLTRVASEAPSLCAGLQDDLQESLLRQDAASQWVAARMLATCGVRQPEAPLAVVQRLLEMAAGGAAACRVPKAATFAVDALVRLLGEEDATRRLRCVETLMAL